MDGSVRAHVVGAIGFLVTGDAALVAVTSIPLTKLTMRLPRKQLLCGAFAVFTVSPFGAAIAANYYLLLVSRGAAAFGHARFWSLIATTAASLFNGASSSRVVSALFNGGSLGAVVGVPAVTWVGEHVGWRAVFGVVTVIGLITPRLPCGCCCRRARVRRRRVLSPHGRTVVRTASCCWLRPSAWWRSSWRRRT